MLLLPLDIKAAQTYAINDKASATHSCSIKTQPNEGGSYLVQGSVHWLDPGDIVTVVDDSKTKSNNSKCSSWI